MRVVLGLLSVLLALWLVVTLVQRQTAAVVPTPSAAPEGQKAQQMQQLQQALDQALQQNQRKLDGATDTAR